MAIATHISACQYFLRDEAYRHAKDRVRVFLGILKAYEAIWPQAGKWSAEIKMMAKAVFEARDKNGELTQDMGYAPDMAMLRSLFE